MQKYNYVAFRGLMGNVYSRGVDACAAKIAKLPHIDYVNVEDYANWRAAMARILKYRDPTILGLSHSFGGNAVTIIAEALRGRVTFPLMLTVDPSPYWSWSLWQSGPSRIGNNVLKTVNMYQMNGLIGRQTLVGVNVSNVVVESSHTEIDDLALVHDRAVQEVQKLA